MTRTPSQCYNPAHGVRFHWAGTEEAIACVPLQRQAASTVQPLRSAATTANPDDAELLARTTSAEFHDLLARRSQLQARYDMLREAAKVLRKDGTGEEIRQSSAAARESYFALLSVRNTVDEYKNKTAALLADYVAEDGYDHTESPTKIGKVTEIGSWEANSEDWLAGRRRGIGGSDVGRLFGKDKNALKEFIIDKAGAWSPRETTDAQQRGIYWEAKIADQFRTEHPEFETTLAKATYRSDETRWQVVNLDGLLTRRGESEPSGVLECKTGGDPKYWENGVPLDYRAQALHYLDATGLDYAYVAAMIDDHDFRTYRIERGEPIDPERPETTYEAIKLYLDEAWTAVDKARAEGLPEDTGSRKVKFKDGDSSLENLAAFRGESLAQTKERYAQVMGELRDIKTKPEREDAAYRRMLAEGADPDASFVYLDLETTGFTPEIGEIAEIGIEVRNAAGEVLGVHDEVFGLDPRFVSVKGTGMEEIHGISVQETLGKRSFADAAEDIRSVMGLNGDRQVIVVGHNSRRFEREWLDANLPGFWESRQKGADGEVKMAELDTMWLTERAVHSTKRNKLESFVEAMGGAYSGAHRALRDSQMTADALQEFRNRAAASGEGRM